MNAGNERAAALQKGLADATSLEAQGRAQEAEQRLTQLLHEHPENGQILHQIALLFYRRGDVAGALERMQGSALALPDDADIQNDLGGLYNVGGRLEEATTCYRRALALAPGNGQAHYNLGCTLHAQGLLQEAEASYRTALQLTGANAVMLCNLGGCLQEQGQLEPAIARYREALELDPHDINSLNNLGFALQNGGELGEAKALFERAIALRPDFARSYVNLGMLLFEQGELELSAATQRQALELDPQFVEAHFGLGIALHALRRPDDAIECYRRVIALRPDHSKSYNNLLMTAQFIPSISAEELTDMHRQFARQFEAPLMPHWPAHANSRDPKRKLKVGYVSADFRSHAVAYFIEPILRHHDREQYEIFCYHNSRRHDDVTERLLSLADHWQPCVSMSDEQLAHKIEADGIDILVDLSGHTAGNRLLAFARKPAPIQITYVGYLSTTGLSGMDYRLTDHLAEPPGSEKYYSERLLRLPHSTWCYQPPADSPELTALPALRKGFVTFGSLNSIDKVDMEVIRIWSRLLQALPTARLLILAVPEARAHFLRQFADCGIDGKRLEFIGKLSPRAYREVVSQIDISLDSYPVNGATTTCESLWQGVPTLSLRGERPLSRNGLSILTAAGMPDFAAASPEELINTATLLCNNLPLLENIRLGMREHLVHTPLFDQRQFTKNLESLFRAAWNEWCEKDH